MRLKPVSDLPPPLDRHRELQDHVQSLMADRDVLGEMGTIRLWVVVVERDHEGQRWLEVMKGADVYRREVVAVLEDAKFAELCRLNESLTERFTESGHGDGGSPSLGSLPQTHRPQPPELVTRQPQPLAQ